jgi:4-coumarate--CoA ligase
LCPMTTIVEKTSDGIIYRAAKTYPIPNVDVLTLLFGELFTPDMTVRRSILGSKVAYTSDYRF